jgi:BirA family biotin operon repressor/biotin-[acetyl-CoA-carboxylase] ligase
MTLVARPTDAAALEVLSLRLGLAAARVLDAFAPSPVRLKWPNDLYVGGGKLAGILAEARWRDGRAEWVAIGFGLNVRPPLSVPGAAGLRAGTRRVDVLRQLVPALRQASEAPGPLDDGELAAFAARDLARGRRCAAPVPGVVQGITAAGELLVASESGVARARAGSLVFAEAEC